MRQAITGSLLIVSLTACHTRPVSVRAWSRDTSHVARLFPARRDSTDSLLQRPRVIRDPTVVVFWLRAADTLRDADRASAFDDLRYYTAQVESVLSANRIVLLATRA